MRDEKARISDKMRKLQAQEQGLQECRAEVDRLERSLKYLEERLADSALMDEDDEVLAATASSCVENYSRLAISAPRPWFRPKPSDTISERYTRPRGASGTSLQPRETTN